MVYCEVCKGSIKKDKEIEVKFENKFRQFCDWECLRIYCDEKLTGCSKD